MDFQNKSKFNDSFESECLSYRSDEQYNVAGTSQQLANKPMFSHDSSELNDVSYEDQINEAIDSKNIRNAFILSVESTLARSTQTELNLAPLGKRLIEYLSEYYDTSSLELERTIYVNFLGKASDISHAQERFIERLKPSLEEFNVNSTNNRTKSSWQAEVAAIIVASYGKASTIPNKIYKKIEGLFGKSVLDRSNNFRNKITQKEALKWLSNDSIRKSVCTYAGLKCENILELSAIE